MAPIDDFSSSNSTLKTPIWFVTIVCLLLAFRVYAKLTQKSAPPDKGIAWMNVEQFDKLAAQPVKDGKDLVLYDFTANWCPPCKKMERTTFRAPSIIKEVNASFVPVRVDLTTNADCEKPAVKRLTDLYSVNTIPRLVVTLRAGDRVCDNRYSQDFGDFLTSAKSSARTIYAEKALAKGDYQAALAGLNSDYVKGDTSVSQYNAEPYLMCHFLLSALNRSAELEPMMQKAYEKTNLSFKKYGSDKPDWLLRLNDYLRGKMTEEALIEAAQSDREKADDYLAISLHHLQSHENDKVIKSLHKTAVFSAKSYTQCSLAEYLLKELDK